MSRQEYDCCEQHISMGHATGCQRAPVTATVEPGRAEDWEDTGPIPLLPAQISTERDFPCCEVRRDDNGATNAAKWRDRGRIIAELIAERDEARAEVDRLGAALVATRDSRDRTVAKGITLAQSWQARAEAAEAEVRDLRAKVAAVEALADEWDRTYNAKPRTLGYASAYVAELRAALASVGRTDTPAPFTRYSGTAGSKVDAALGPQGEAAEHGGTAPLSTKDDA